jgi:hypothetical protein
LVTEDRGVASRAGPWVWQVVAASLGLLALALISGGLGDLSQALNGTLAVATLAGLAVLLPGRPDRKPLWRCAAALALLIMTLPLVARGGPLGLLAAALFFFALSLTKTAQIQGQLTALLVTALLMAAYRLGVAHVPAMWHGEHALAMTVSGLVGMGLKLGPTALGLPLFVLFALHAVSTFVLAVAGQGHSDGAGGLRWRRLGIFVLWLLGLALAVVAFVWLQPPLGSWTLTRLPESGASLASAPEIPTLTYLESQALLFALVWLVSTIGSAGLRPGRLVLAPAGRYRWWAVAGLGLLALATGVLTLDPPFQPRRGAVLVYDAGHLEWGRPDFGQYGPQSGGAFGLLPDYLAAYGYGLASGPLTAESLQEARAVMLINLPDNLDEGEEERLLEYVARGGGLVIWGEHTGVEGIREPINDVLAGLPMQLRFDSAVPSRLGWSDGLALLPHPVVQGVRDAADLVIAVGASLDIGPPARPIIVGRYGHSDRGNAANRARNYVGDMRYNSGEPLGDLVLAAEVRHGDGRILMVGDTTPLGSVNLMTTMPFLARMLDWVTAEPVPGWESVLLSDWLAAALLVMAVGCLALGRSRLTLAGAALAVGLVLALTTGLNQARSEPALPVGPIAYVDISHQERFDRLLWEEDSIGGLDYNLVRNGALPLLLRGIDAEALAEAELLVIIAPGDRFSAAEVETVARWVADGGRLLVAVGFEESAASADLLRAFGLEVEHIPLGPAQAGHESGLAQFHEAWPVRAQAENAKTIVEAYGYPLAVFQPWGEGSVVLIGDSAFLLGGSLEDQSSHQEGNILLLRDVLQGYLGLGGTE